MLPDYYYRIKEANYAANTLAEAARTVDTSLLARSPLMKKVYQRAESTVPQMGRDGIVPKHTSNEAIQAVHELLGKAKFTNNLAAKNPRYKELLEKQKQW